MGRDIHVMATELATTRFYFSAGSLSMAPEPRISPFTSPQWMRLHLTSLEAPAIAVLWAMALAKVNHQPFLPEFGAALFLTVWFIYLVNHALAPAETREPRHLGSRLSPVSLIILMLLMVSLNGVLALYHLPAALMASGMQLCGLVTGYFGIYGSRWNRALLALAQGSILMPLVITLTMPNWIAQWLLLTVSLMTISHAWKTSLWFRLRQKLNKDVAGGLLFSMGCCQWSQFLRSGDDPVGDWIQYGLLGSLMISNLSLLSGTSDQRRRWLKISIGLSLLVLSSQGLKIIGTPQIQLAWACLLGSALLMLMEKAGKNWSHDSKRTSADLAIAVPAVALCVL